MRRRADLLDRARRFFSSRGVLEVDVPLLARGVIVEEHIDPIECRVGSLPGHEEARLHLAASPEAGMKRLLAAGSGPIFQLSRAFRDGELGRLHQPEFRILEWYRPGFTLEALMDEVAALVEALLGRAGGERRTYREVFLDALGIDPLEAPATELAAAAARLGVAAPSSQDPLDRDAWLDLLLTQRIEPRLGTPRPLFVHRYPRSQAALARIAPDDPRVAERFELYIDGVELANGYHELTDAGEQRRRFDSANARRVAAGKAALPVDEDFLRALEDGMPDSCGVAVGFDRIVMLACGAPRLADVLPFAFERVE